MPLSAYYFYLANRTANQPCVALVPVAEWKLSQKEHLRVRRRKPTPIGMDAQQCTLHGLAATMNKPHSVVKIPVLRFNFRDCLDDQSSMQFPRIMKWQLADTTSMDIPLGIPFGVVERNVPKRLGRCTSIDWAMYATPIILNPFPNICASQRWLRERFFSTLFRTNTIAKDAQVMDKRCQRFLHTAIAPLVTAKSKPPMG